MFRQLVVASLLVLIALAPGAGRAEPPKLVAVMPLNAQHSRLGPADRMAIEESIRTLAGAVLTPVGYTVLGGDNTLRILQDNGVDPAKACDASCALDAAREMKASIFLSGSLATYEEGGHVGYVRVFESGGRQLSQVKLEGRRGSELVASFEAQARSVFELAGLLRSSAEVRIIAPEDAAPEVADEVVVQFASTPPGAVVLVDGVVVCRATPCSKEAAVGRHTISMQLDEYEPAVESVALARGSTIALTLVPSFATLEVETVPPGLGIAVDDRNVGRAPLRAFKVKAEAHEIVVDDRCYLPDGEKIVVRRGEKRKVRIEAKPRLVALRVRAEDADGNAKEATVEIDGREAGRAPATLQVPICAARIALTDGLARWSGQLALTADGSNTVTARLQRGAAAEPAPAGRERPRHRRIGNPGPSDLNRGVEAYNGGSYAAAANAFAQIALDADEPEIVLRAEYFLAVSERKLGLNYAALLQARAILGQGANHPYYAKAAELLLDVREALDDRIVVPALLDKQYAAEAFAKLPAEAINHANLLVGLRALHASRVDEAMEFLEAVHPDSRHARKARYALAVRTASQDAAAAAAELSKLVRDTAPAKGVDAFHDLVSLAAARVAYAREQFARARLAYAALADRQPKFFGLAGQPKSVWRREALREGAWAAYADGDEKDALARLDRLAQEFPDDLAGDGELLRATIAHLDCRFGDVRRMAEAWQQRYGVVRETLEQAKPDAIATAWLQANPVLAPEILLALESDATLGSLRRFDTQLVREQNEASRILGDTELALELGDDAAAGREHTRAAVARRVQHVLAELKETLGDLNGRFELLRFESAGNEKEALERGWAGPGCPPAGG